MALITDLLTTLDNAVDAAFGASKFTEVVLLVRPLFQASAAIIIATLGINMMLQWRPMSMGDAFSIGIRIALVSIFAFHPGNFFVVYDALSNAPATIGITLLTGTSGGSETSLYDALDGVYVKALSVGNVVADNGGWVAGALTAVLLFLVAALMATVTIIVLGLAKMMIALLAAIAPLMILLTIFPQSKPIFEAWLKMAIGFAFVPMLVASVIGIIMGVADVIDTNLENAETLAGVISFVVVCLVGTGLLMMVPSTASSLAATSISLGTAMAMAQRQASWAGGKAMGLARGAAGSAGKLGQASHNRLWNGNQSGPNHGAMAQQGRARAAARSSTFKGS